MIKQETTLDSLLGGKVQITQPKEGFRTCIDSIFLAAFVHPKKEARVLDAGAGCGPISLLLPFFFPDKSLSIIAVEKDPFLCSLVQKNVKDNELQETINVLCEDVLSSSLPTNHFDCVVTNPPFYDGTRVSKSSQRAQALHAPYPTFEKWFDKSLRFLKQGGAFTTILPPERLEELLKIVQGKLGALRLFPLWPKAGENAHRILIQGIKGRKTKLSLEPGLILHTDQGTYTAQAQNILREGLAL